MAGGAHWGRGGIREGGNERLQEVLLLGDRGLAERFEEMGEIEVAKRVISMSEPLTRAVP